MRRLILFFLPLLLAVCLSGCRTAKTAGRSAVDSVRVETRYRTEYKTDTVTLRIPVERYAQVKSDSSHLETEYAVSDALLQSDGKLRHTLENKAGELPVKVMTRVEYKDSIVYRDRNVVERVEVKKPLTDWQRLQMWGFWVMLSFAAGVFLNKAGGIIKDRMNR